MMLTEAEKKRKLQDLYLEESKRLSALTDDMGMYNDPVFGVGKLSPLVCVIGEAPGAEEVKAKTPFVGKAGKNLDELFSVSGISREELFITNSVKFRPIKKKLLGDGRISISNRTPTTAEINEGSTLIAREISIISPKIIVTLGNSPLYQMCVLFSLGNKRIGEVHGQAIPISANIDCILFPLYHPASVIYNRELKETLKRDMNTLGKIKVKGESK